jgi:hypothetical protein
VRAPGHEAAPPPGLILFMSIEAIHLRELIAGLQYEYLDQWAYVYGNCEITNEPYGVLIRRNQLLSWFMGNTIDCILEDSDVINFLTQRLTPIGIDLLFGLEFYDD